MGSHRQAFRALWDELNGHREYAWEANPWVWVVTFEFERHIRPYPPRDGMDWECQCARCGSSTDFQACEECDDGYIEDDWGDDVVSEMHIVACQFCRGHGGYYVCTSSREFCKANPLPCRESVERGEIEWFRVQCECS